jgi:hypothetical protein
MAQSRESKNQTLTKNDLDILDKINRFGFLTVREIARMTDRQETVIYRRIKLLCDGDYLNHKLIFWGQPGAYWLTYKGKTICNSPLSTIRCPSVGTYAHELKVAEVYINLKGKYGDKFSWLTARELVSEKVDAAADYARAFKSMKTRRTPDGVLLYNSQKIAIEVELSLKRKIRQRQIISNYMKLLNHGIFDMVIYFIDKTTVGEHLKEAIEAADPASVKFHIRKI